MAADRRAGRPGERGVRMRAVLTFEAEGDDAVARIRELLDAGGGREAARAVTESPAGDTGPVAARSATALLDLAPREVGGLPAFLARLDDVQADRVWVAALIDAVLAAGGRVAVGDLARVCNAVRDRYRVRCAMPRTAACGGDAEDSGEGAQTHAETSPAGEPETPPTTRDDSADGLRRALLAACPNVGDETAARAIALHKDAMARLKSVVVARDPRFAWVAGRPGGHPPARVRRVR